MIVALVVAVCVLACATVTVTLSGARERSRLLTELRHMTNIAAAGGVARDVAILERAQTPSPVTPQPTDPKPKAYWGTD